ncbi:hypothetical protein Lbys_2798 [Leadbetterella byssophila DSM 17132]|uniref:HmuY protein n=1 Tax=Leadbetterella byssophila (strain DSM 17132 / JCM 16389 / KACC 11308 / NBRC 106382 / 4M15) TaxID=649349 RepID=E4RRC7_LEAB4|nr:HmuY family protein [Leadbetterella byssophila]ADQ18460.1 hypothetical protein Lbys_2798 [Leadbetterella byssophila DSM 17132]
MKKLILPLLVIGLSSCSDDKIERPDNFLNFKTNQVGLSGESSVVDLQLTQAHDEEIQIQINFLGNGVEYGKHFTTEPSGTGNALHLTIPKGNAGTSFKIIPIAGVLFKGTETIDFTLSTVSSPIIVGSTKNLKLTFSSIISEGSQMTLESKTSESNYTNNVYVDFSANTTHLSGRKDWNLGFTNDQNFRVILNHSLQTTAAATTQTDITKVSLADTATTPDIYISTARITDPNTTSLVDSWDGDLNKTVFAEVSATENKVYLVAFEGKNSPKTSWYKVKVERSGNGYKVQYAPIGDNNIKTVEIPKNQNTTLSYLSFDKGQVNNVEPTTWDIQYGYSTYDSGMKTPYWFQDFILLNYLGGAEAAEISNISYENYTETHIASTTFLKTRDAIGSKWRITTGANAGIVKDKFYIIKDPDGNYYKLRILSFGVGSGERGKPVIEYKLVKKG